MRESDRLKYVHSDIRGPLYIEALRMEEEGTPVLKLNTGNPARFGFGMPQSVKNALLAGLDEATAYCDVKGMKDARSSILSYHLSKGLKDITMEDIFICNGVSEAVSLLMSAFVNPEDEILMPSPCYSLWSNNAYLCDGKPVFYRCDETQGWQPDLADMEAKINEHTTAILIINPNNPTGALYSRQTLEMIAELARKYHLVLFADEIYDRLVMDDLEHESIAAIAPDVPCVTFNGLSKSHIICGFRCGWMVFTGPAEELAGVRDGVSKLAAMRLCGNALTQLVIPAALEDDASTRSMMVPGGRLYEQRAVCMKVLSQIEGVHCVSNQASFYIFPSLERECFDFADDKDFAMKLLHEKKILVVPGSGFEYVDGLNFRIVMLPEAERLLQAMNDLKDFLEAHRIQK